MPDMFFVQQGRPDLYRFNDTETGFFTRDFLLTITKDFHAMYIAVFCSVDRYPDDPFPKPPQKHDAKWAQGMLICSNMD